MLYNFEVYMGHHEQPAKRIKHFDMCHPTEANTCMQALAAVHCCRTDGTRLYAFYDGAPGALVWNSATQQFSINETLERPQ